MTRLKISPATASVSVGATQLRMNILRSSRFFASALLLIVLSAFTVSSPALSQGGSFQFQASPPAGTLQPPIENGERLSQWMLKERQSQQGQSALRNASPPYYLGTSWQTPKEVAAQEAAQSELLRAFEKMTFSNDAAGQRAKKAFTQLISQMRATGRVSLPSTNPRYLEVNPKIDPVLERGDRIVVPETMPTLTVIRSNGSLCKIRYRPNIEARFYVEGCRLSGKQAERSADWAWIVEPDGAIKKVSIAAWNSSAQDLPAPGSWIWAPPRWSQWTNANGERFSEALTTLLAAQGPSGQLDSLDHNSSARANLPNVSKDQLYSVSRDLPISANVWGETGLLQTPSARTSPAGTAAATLGLFQPYANLNLFFAPINGVEFILRYTNINNVAYGPQSFSGGQSYKDKSTGLKVRLLKENAYLPEFAVGVRDLLGTGLFSGEYAVANKRYRDLDFTAGMGWGQLGTRNNITNPFVTAFGQNFATRDAAVVGQGGTPNQQYFHGNAALFGGVQYHTPWKNLVLKAEVDGNNYQQLPFGNTLPIKSIFNFGATYQMKNADFTVGVLGNSQVMFSISLHERLDTLNTPKLAEAKSVPVDLKTVGSYNPNQFSNPALFITANTPSAAGATSVTAPASVPAATAVTAKNANDPVVIEATASTSSKVNVSSTQNPLSTDARNAPSSSVGLQKQIITTQYNSTLVDFEQQTQWQVKGLRGSGKVWTVHLQDASGVFLRSRINRGITVLHRDAPSAIETFQIQFYNWGMLVSEFQVDRKQWMLNQTQLLPPSARYPSITSVDTAALPADGGNPFFRSPSRLSSSVAPALIANDQGSSLEPVMIDKLDHKPYRTNIGISYAQIVGSPDAPFLFALGVKADGLYKFRENTWVTGTVNARLVDNFGKYVIDPAPTGLQPVRTDIRSYVTQSIATMPNLQITNTGKVANNHFVSAYAGYLEMMFAGAGGEYLWRPSNSRVALGADINRVRQRQFNVWTSLQDYAVTTGHVTGYWDTGVQDILVKLSYGKYLAGDVGGTLDLSRVFKNGVKIGAYATRTNVDYAQFGEGSFDKGVYLSIPFDAFFARHSDSSANLLFTPLIRDGGAMLLRKYRLYDMTRTRDSRALTAGPD
jgi:hypothetical protein